jgi:membrane-associated phospholipid phosphatase
MIRQKLIISFIIVLFFNPHLLPADDHTNNTNSERLTPLTDIGGNFVDSYSGWNSLFHIAAIGITYVSVQTGFDAGVLRITSGMDPAFSGLVGHTGVMLGYFVPIIVPATMYFISDNNRDLRYASYAVMQSVAVAFAVGSLLKAVTGRKGPDPDDPDKDGLSQDFKFGFLEGGLHYGWPSGHLMVNTAMVTALVAYYPEKSWVKNVAYGYLAFLTFSMLIHDRGRAHWFSDIVAGGLMGFAFGTTIGKNFRHYRNPNQLNTAPGINSSSSLQLYPLLNPDYTGFVLRIGF